MNTLAKVCGFSYSVAALIQFDALQKLLWQSVLFLIQGNLTECPLSSFRFLLNIHRTTLLGIIVRLYSMNLRLQAVMSLAETCICE